MISDRVLLGFAFQHSEDHSGSSPQFDIPSPAPATSAQPIYYPTPIFNLENRYNPTAPYNLAPRYTLPKGFGLPLARNFDYASFIKTTTGNNTETNDKGFGLPLFIELPNKPLKGSFQWDSFPAGEAQQFLVFSVTSELINSQDLYNGENGGATAVVLDAISSSQTERPFTISLSVTPYNSGPIPHIHWAEDEWFILLQGEMDSWLGDPTDNAYELYEFPDGSAPLPSNYDGPILTADNIDTFYYSHLTAGQSVYLPRGYAHAYRNASPSGDPLVFLTIWSRTPGYPEGGIEQFFTLPDPLIGRFYDTSDDAASYGNLYNKNVGSPEGISNQQRLVDYYNTFPEYFVAMSRNFGSFTSPDSAGGNWNPSIPNDTTPFGTPPPAYWQPTSGQPWLADSITPGAQQYYLPPGPNAPSKAVSFAIPLDPTVVQVSTFTYTGADDVASVQAFEEQLSNVVDFLSASQGVQYSLLLSPRSSTANATSYVIQTTWDTFSSLNALQSSSELAASLNEVLKSSTLSTANNTVNSDLFAENEQIVVGRFAIKPSEIDQALALSAVLQKQTAQEPGNISFNYYIDEKEPSTIVYIEQYSNGPALTAHLTAGYTTAFFAQLGPLTETGILADANVGIYPVNSASSTIFPEQVQGVELLNDILLSMPELQLSLTNEQGLLTASTPSRSQDIGGYVLITNQGTRKDIRTYGYLDPESGNPVILFEQDDSLGASLSLSGLLQRAVALTSTEGIQLFGTGQSASSVINDGLKGAILSDARNLVASPGGTASFLGLSIELDVPYQGIQHVSSLPQTNAQPLMDLTQVPRRDVSGSVHVYNSKGQHLDRKLALDYGLYSVINESGSILDSVTGVEISASRTKKYNAAVTRQGSSSAGPDDQFTVLGGAYFAPYIEIGRRIYTPFNSGFSILGANTFLFETRQGDFITTVDFLSSDQIPLLA